jgi:hypothetical protein
MPLAEHNNMIKATRQIEPMSRSANPFCHGERGDVSRAAPVPVCAVTIGTSRKAEVPPAPLTTNSRHEAGRKSAGAGKLQTADGRVVMFVADPGKAPRQAGTYYARPGRYVES